MTAAKPDNGESDGPAKESDFAPGSLSEELMSQLSDAPQCLRALQVSIQSHCRKSLPQTTLFRSRFETLA